MAKEEADQRGPLPLALSSGLKGKRAAPSLRAKGYPGMGGGCEETKVRELRGALRLVEEEGKQNGRSPPILEAKCLQRKEHTPPSRSGTPRLPAGCGDQEGPHQTKLEPVHPTGPKIPPLMSRDFRVRGRAPRRAAARRVDSE